MKSEVTEGEFSAISECCRVPPDSSNVVLNSSGVFVFKSALDGVEMGGGFSRLELSNLVGGLKHALFSHILGMIPSSYPPLILKPSGSFY